MIKALAECTPLFLRCPYSPDPGHMGQLCWKRRTDTFSPLKAAYLLALSGGRSETEIAFVSAMVTAMNAIRQLRKKTTVSDACVSVRLAELMALKDEGKIVVHGHRQYVVIDDKLRPVKIVFPGAT